MTSYSRFGVTSYNPTTLIYNYPATCLNNKLTDLINDGVREVDCTQAKTTMNEGSSAINKTRWLEGNRKEDNRTEKKIKIIDLAGAGYFCGRTLSSKNSSERHLSLAVHQEPYSQSNFSKFLDFYVT